jgi:hypothetical protein
LLSDGRSVDAHAAGLCVQSRSGRGNRYLGQDRSTAMVNVLARLKPGVTAAQLAGGSASGVGERRSSEGAYHVRRQPLRDGT